MKTKAIRTCIQFRQEYETDSGIHLAQRASAELAALKEENERLRKALATSQANVLLLLDQVDYTAGRCQVNEMVGAVLPTEVIVLIKDHITSDQRLAALGQEGKHEGDNDG